MSIQEQINSFIAEEKEHGPYFTKHGTLVFIKAMRVEAQGVYISELLERDFVYRVNFRYIDFEELAAKYEWQDGTPITVLGNDRIKRQD